MTINNVINNNKLFNLPKLEFKPPKPNTGLATQRHVAPSLAWFKLKWQLQRVKGPVTHKGPPGVEHTCGGIR